MTRRSRTGLLALRAAAQIVEVAADAVRAAAKAVVTFVDDAIVDIPPPCHPDATGGVACAEPQYDAGGRCVVCAHPRRCHAA